MKLRILADENIPAVEHYIGELGTVRRFNGRSLGAGQLTGVDVLLVRSVTTVDARLLDNSAVRFVGTATSGFDHIDRAYLQQRQIVFRHAPGSNANSVVEYVLAAIAGVADHLERVLAGAPVGIVGYGHVGRAVAARLRALDINCCVYDPWLGRETIDSPAELAEILSCAVVTLHPELTDRSPWPSRHLLGETALGRLAPDCLLINASRGAVVDNRALLALLQRGNAPDTVLDVWEGEPAINHQLLRLTRYGTPHIAGYSLDGKLLATRMLVEGMALELGLPWRDPGSAAVEPAPLEVTAQDTGANLLRAVISQRYDIAADDAALREATLGVDVAAAASGFDRLRREYPDRREILGSRVRLQPSGARERRLLTGLGCLVGSIEE